MFRLAIWKAVLVAACLLIVFVEIIIADDSRDDAKLSVWQYSVSPVVRIGIRDKPRTHGKFTAEFRVFTPDGKEHRLTRQVAEGKWGYVFFPTDFDTWWMRGEVYRWQCRVHDEVIAQGEFRHHYLPPTGEEVEITDGSGY